MKRLLHVITFIAFTCIINNTLKGQCTNNNIFYTTLNPTTANATVTASCAFGGEYVDVNVVAGRVYNINTCNTLPFFGGFDSQITLFQGAGAAVLGYDDDGCAPYSTLNWTATFTGVLRVVIDEFSCVSGTSCFVLEVTWVQPSCTALPLIPVCTQVGLNYPAGVNTGDGTVTDPVNDWDCLITAPNANFYYFEIATAGNINMTLTGTSDVDFIIWGPFPNLAAANSSCGLWGSGGTNGSVIDCSYDPAALEFPVIPGAIVGQVYVMSITNFANVAQNLTLTQSSGTGSTNCNIVNPPSCLANAGTVTTRLNGNIVTSPVLMCKGSCLTVETDSNFVLPTPVVGEQAELMYAIYDGVPNPAITDPSLDPNFTTLFWTGGDFSDCNTPASIILGAALGNRIWMVPITMDDGDNNGNPNTVINYDNNLDNCYDMGIPVEIIFLDSIRATFLQNCNNVVVTLTGGYPGFNPAATYTVVNTGAGSMVQSGTRGQTLTFSGYTGGQTISFNVSNDGNSCAASFSQLTNSANSITLNSITNSNCNGNTGAVNISVTAAPCVYTLNMSDSYGDGWNGGFLTIRANGTAIPGSPFSVSAAQGFNSSVTFSIPAGQTLQLTYTAGTWEAENSYNLVQNGTTIFSAGPTPGTGIVFTTTCAGSFNYSWSNGAITQDLTNVGANNYTVTVTDAGGCSFTGGPYTVNATAAPTATIASSTNVTCNGGTTGSVNLNAAGGSPGYTFLWSNGRTTQNNTGIGAGSYTVTVTDAGLCTATASITITQPTVVTATATPTNVNCNGASTGSVSLIASGGTPAYNFIWSNGVNTQNNTGINAGIYTVTISDVNGCTSTATTTITQPSALTTNTVAVTDATCSLGGTVNISVSGGSSGYSFAWNNGATTEDLSGLSSGNYTLTISDANGCTITNGPNTVNAIGTPSTSLSTSTNVSCIGNANGSINISVNGGTPAYIFTWSNGATSEDISGLSAGNYAVTVTDNIGCTSTLSNISISEPTVLLAVTTPSNVNCNGAANGSIAVSVTGGTPNYSYAWSNGATNEDLTGLSGNTYSLTVNDANGCILIVSPVTITEPSAVTLSFSSFDAGCGVADGSISITPSGGIPGYTYLWNNSATTQNISGLAAGDYDVIITDVNGCSHVENNITVGGGSNISLTLSSVNEACGQTGTGAVSLTASGGTAPLTYLWSNGETTEDLATAAAGNYSVTVTGADACVSTGSSTVSALFQPVLNAGVLPSMATDTTITWGQLTTLSGGNDQTASGVTYSWVSVGPSNANFSTVSEHNTNVQPDDDGIYAFIITATSLDGCTDTDTLNVTVQANKPSIPTAFSPNGDNNNDIFQVVNMDKQFIREFKIHNRWGQLVYDNATDAAWDGKFKSIEQPRDVYIYTISWESATGADLVVKRGSVTLLK